MQEVGATVLRHQGRKLHAKAGLIDDTGWVGSANFDMRSLLLNFEIAMFCHDKSSNDLLETWFQTQSGNRGRGMADARLPRRVVEGVFRLGAPVL